MHLAFEIQAHIIFLNHYSEEDFDMMEEVDNYQVKGKNCEDDT